MPRPTIKTSMLVADPDTADPAANIVRAPSMVARRPNIWASFPLKGKQAADDKLYAEATQEKSSPWSSLTIVGAAVATDACYIYTEGKFQKLFLTIQAR